MAALKCKGPKVKTNFPISKYALPSSARLVWHSHLLTCCVSVTHLDNPASHLHCILSWQAADGGL